MKTYEVTFLSHETGGIEQTVRFESVSAIGARNLAWSFCKASCIISVSVVEENA